MLASIFAVPLQARHDIVNFDKVVHKNTQVILQFETLDHLKKAATMYSYNGGTG